MPYVTRHTSHVTHHTSHVTQEKRRAREEDPTGDAVRAREDDAQD